MNYLLLPFSPNHSQHYAQPAPCPSLSFPRHLPPSIAPNAPPVHITSAIPNTRNTIRVLHAFFTSSYRPDTHLPGGHPTLVNNTLLPISAHSPSLHHSIHFFYACPRAMRLMYDIINGPLFLCPLCQSQSLYPDVSDLAPKKTLLRQPTKLKRLPLLANPDMLVLQISSYSSRHPRLYSFFITHTIPTLHYTKPILPCLPPITHLSIMLYFALSFSPVSLHMFFFCYIPKVFFDG